MDNVISLGVGEPDFHTPWHAREAGIYALEKGLTTYTPNAGLISLREAICRTHEERYKISYDPNVECLVTTGVSQGLDLALRTILTPGDEVLVPEPCYVAYEPCISFASGIPIPVPSNAKDGFRFDPELAATYVTNRTKAIITSSPANPTGVSQTREDLISLVDLAISNDLYIISDEIYDRLTYGRPHISVTSLPGARDRTVLLNGFSKAYAMTGWRVGYACAPAEIAEHMIKMHQYTMLCASHVAQIAALAAITECDDQVDEMVADYERRRRMFVDGLRAIGLDCVEPDGAFYAFPSIAATGLDSSNFAEKLILSERVAVVPGHVFGAAGEGHVRCCYATALPLLEQALERIDHFVRKVA
jgi:aminotransferase